MRKVIVPVSLPRRMAVTWQLQVPSFFALLRAAGHPPELLKALPIVHTHTPCLYTARRAVGKGHC
jgi:hypothetical protein